MSRKALRTNERKKCRGKMKCFLAVTQLSFCFTKHLKETRTNSLWYLININNAHLSLVEKKSDKLWLQTTCWAWSRPCDDIHSLQLSHNQLFCRVRVKLQLCSLLIKCFWWKLFVLLLLWFFKSISDSRPPRNHHQVQLYELCLNLRNLCGHSFLHQ